MRDRIKRWLKLERANLRSAARDEIIEAIRDGVFDNRIKSVLGDANAELQEAHEAHAEKTIASVQQTLNKHLDTVKEHREAVLEKIDSAAQESSSDPAAEAEAPEKTFTLEELVAVKEDIESLKKGKMSARTLTKIRKELEDRIGVLEQAMNTE